MTSLDEAIREDPDRFMVDMDLREIFDKETFNKEILTAQHRVTRSYGQQVDRWTQHSNTLFGTKRVRDIIIANVEGNKVTLKKRHGQTGEFITIRGYQKADGTFIMTKEVKGLSGNKIKLLVRRGKVAK